MKHSITPRWFLCIVALCTLSLLGGTAMADSSALFRYNGKTYQASDFSNQIRQYFFQAQQDAWRKQREIADIALFNLHLEAEARRQNTTVQAVADAMLDIRNPDEATVKAFYEQNRAQINAPLEQVRSEIAQFLINQQMEQKRAAVVARLKQEGNFALLIPAPVPPLLDITTEGYPFKGNPKAQVTLVEFADYQCPHCRMMAQELRKLMRIYGDKVKLVFRDYPINRSGISRRVAEGAVCAQVQGKFWEYHDAAFDLQDGLNHNSPLDIATTLKLDRKKFEQCLDAPATKERVARSKAEGDGLNIQATPTIYINGRFVYDHDHEVDLAVEIEKALKAKK